MMPSVLELAWIILKFILAFLVAVATLNAVVLGLLALGFRLFDLWEKVTDRL